jgi:hypothetical protein
LDLTSRMTIEAWVYPTTLSSWRTVILKEMSGSLSYALYAYDNAPRPAAYINTGGSDLSALGTAGIALNTWTHLAATYDGTTLRLFVNGTQVGSRATTGSIRTSTNPLRIGGNVIWGEYFSGRIDEVRIYNRALSQAEIQTDMNTAISSSDTTPPTVSSISPTSNASGVSIDTNVTVTFSEAMDPTTISTSTIELRDPSSTLVPASVNYNGTTRVATLDPSASLAYSTAYTATVKGGTSGVKDVAGNPLASNYAWSFTTGSAGSDPGQGSGGPVLVIASSSNPFTRYYAEILRTEGFNSFWVMDIAEVSTATLTNYDTAILGEITLTTDQVTMLTNWVNTGGNLVAMRPDKKLASLLGLTDASTTLSDRYLLIGTANAPGQGLVDETIQFHGTADRYTLNGATTIATLYSTSTTATSNPAVTLRSVGTGQAAAFTYDLAKSVVYTRQGNPAWSGQERDGISIIRPDDLFYPDWIDLDKVAVPQADEQQRLLANLIIHMTFDKKPLPRFWYFPRSLEAVVIMTGDDHGVVGPASRFDDYMGHDPGNCSLTNWECVRSTAYLMYPAILSDSTAVAYHAAGFELSIHLDTRPDTPSDHYDCTNWTSSSLATFFTTQMDTFSSLFPTLPPPSTHRTHCIVWSDYDTQPQVEFNNGIRFDTNYYYYPPNWVANRPGFFTGSGMPMRFTKADGTLIDVYQAATQMTDESGQTYPNTINTLLDNAIDLGYYGAFTTNIHTDDWGGSSIESEAVITSALARDIPVISARQMLEWLDGRNTSTFSGITWNGTILSFTIAVGQNANGLVAMVPIPSGRSVTGVTRNGSPVSFSSGTIKGIPYVIFYAGAGSHQVTFGS